MYFSEHEKSHDGVMLLVNLCLQNNRRITHSSRAWKKRFQQKNPMKLRFRVGFSINSHQIKSVKHLILGCTNLYKKYSIGESGEDISHSDAEGYDVDEDLSIPLQQKFRGIKSK